MTTSSSLGQMEQFKDCFKWDNVCEGIRCSGEQTGLFNKCYCSVPFPSLRAIWEVAPRHQVCGQWISVALIPSKLNFTVGEKLKISESLAHKGTPCVVPSYYYSGIFWHCPWLFLPDSWQPHPFSSWPEAKWVHVHPLGKCAVSFVS